MSASQFDIVIIGARPSDAVAPVLLNKRGFRICVLEKQRFPCFIIGENLLPYCMEMLEEAGFADTVHAEPSSQFKNGTALSWGGRYIEFDLTKKFSDGPGTVYQVCHGIFGKILIGEVAKQGVGVRFGHGVTASDNGGDSARLSVETDMGEGYELTAEFILDANGYGRVPPRLLDLETPSHLPSRQTYFTHTDDNITNPKLDRSKIPIITHSQHRDVWVWLIPFGDSRCPISVVDTSDALAGESEIVSKKFVYECPMLKEILDKAVWENDFPFRSIQGYFANVKSLHGKHFALLGNAVEFLGSVFSSGIAIVLHSTKLAADLLAKQLEGDTADWDAELTKPLMIGVNTSRTYVNGWYDFRFQSAIYALNRSPEISRMISLILAGYAWDIVSSFVAKPKQRLPALAALVGDVKVEWSGSERSVRRFRRSL